MIIDLAREIYQYELLMKQDELTINGILLYSHLMDFKKTIIPNPKGVADRDLSKTFALLRAKVSAFKGPKRQFNKTIDNVMVCYKISDNLEINYHRALYDKVNIKHALMDEILIVLQLRYRSLRLYNGNSAAVPKQYYNQLDKSTIECYASYINRTFDRYCCLFPDIEYIYGGLCNLYNLSASDMLNNDLVANPPFTVPEINKLIAFILSRKIKRMLIILPTFDINHRKMLNKLAPKHSQLLTDYVNDVHTTDLLKVCNYCALYSRNTFPYYDYLLGKFVNYAATTLITINWDIYKIFPKPTIIL
jgi:hypothetical protein